MKRIALAALALLLAVGLGAQSRFYYFNGVGYEFPSSQGGAGQVLTNDGSGGLTWATTVSPEGLWTGAVIVSTSSCPTGYTRFSSADGRVLRGAASAGDPSGSDTHVHTLTGSTAGQAVTIAGTTGSASPSVTGSTGSTDIGHTHGNSPSTTTLGSGGTTVLQSVTISSGGGSHSHTSGSLSGSSHSHGDGSLAGASHTHAVGTLATVSASNLPAYYGVILCRKD